MNNLIHEETDEDKIIRHSQDEALIVKLLNANANLTQRLAKSNGNGWFAGILLVLMGAMLICTAIWCGSQQSTIRAYDYKFEQVTTKSSKILDKYNLNRMLLSSHTTFLGLPDSKRKMFTDSIKLERRGNTKKAPCK